jgi:hypothetical protein
MLGGTRLHFGRYQFKKGKEDDGNFNIGLVLGAEVELLMMRRFKVWLERVDIKCFLKSSFEQLDYFLNLGQKITS